VEESDSSFCFPKIKRGHEDATLLSTQNNHLDGPSYINNSSYPLLHPSPSFYSFPSFYSSYFSSFHPGTSPSLGQSSSSSEGGGGQQASRNQFDLSSQEEGGETDVGCRREEVRELEEDRWSESGLYTLWEKEGKGRWQREGKEGRGPRASEARALLLLPFFPHRSLGLVADQADLILRICCSSHLLPSSLDLDLPLRRPLPPPLPNRPWLQSSSTLRTLQYERLPLQLLAGFIRSQELLDRLRREIRRASRYVRSKGRNETQRARGGMLADPDTLLFPSCSLDGFSGLSEN